MNTSEVKYTSLDQHYGPRGGDESAKRKRIDDQEEKTPEEKVRVTKFHSSQTVFG